MSAASSERERDHHAALDARMVEATRGIRLLSSLSWPVAVQKTFLADWKKGKAKPPVIDYPRFEFDAVRGELDAIRRDADAQHPLGDYLIRTADSWHTATELIDAAGSAALTAHSVRLFGRSDDRVPGAKMTHVDAARHFISIADELHAEDSFGEESHEVPAEVLREELVGQLDDFFGVGVVAVEMDPDLIAKAAAGASRIRLRASTTFSDYDRAQLLVHEAFVHTLTGQNGRVQPYMKSLATSSPRITATQEGLAVFAELISGSIDILRMKRISLRILAIDHALGGASFIDVFRFFLDSGQNEADSFASAQRVFRGVPTTGGGGAFTKDAVYLHGLLSVHTFFRWAFKNRRMALCRNLFAGKLALHDVVSLEPCFADGTLVPPRWLPPWAQHFHGLAGKLAFSLFANRIRLDRVEAEDLVLGL